MGCRSLYAYVFLTVVDAFAALTLDLAAAFLVVATFLLSAIAFLVDGVL